MGFGWLVVGYFFSSVVSLYSTLSYAMLVGYPMMIIGLHSLAPYHPYFRYSYYLSFASLPFALYYAANALRTMGLFTLPIFEGAWWNVIGWAHFLFVIGFTLLILLAINGLCAELALVKWRTATLRNVIILALTYGIDLIFRLPIGALQSLAGYIAAPVLLLRLILIFSNLYLFYGCYRHIVPEGENTPMLELDLKGGKSK